jgi:anti-anti-sigma regulatory factor
MGSSLKVVTMEGRGTVETATAKASTLLDALSENEKVLLNLSHLEQIDASFVHILYAAAAEAEKRGIRFGLTGALQPGFRSALEVGGFCNNAPEQARDLHGALIDFPAAIQPEEDPDA